MKRKILTLTAILLLLVVAGFAVYQCWLRPTRIAFINALPAQKTDIALCNDADRVQLDFIDPQDVTDLTGYDAVLMFGRSLYLDEEQMAHLQSVIDAGMPVFTMVNRHANFEVKENLTTEQCDTLQQYLIDACKQNYRNVVRYVRHIATPQLLGDQDYEPPYELPHNMFYHREAGKYFATPDELTDYLKANKLYNEGGKTVCLINGVSFPVEGNRPHIDTLITRLTSDGYNVYPLTAMAKGREKLIRKLHPDAMIYIPMGRLGNDTLTTWIAEQNIPIFNPFPTTQSHKDWLETDNPLSGGSLTARIVVAEVDGGISPYLVATQNESSDGYVLFTPESERINAFMDNFNRYMRLRTMANKDKRIAICYFKNPGSDALIASGMEVAPSLYNLLLRMHREGYDVAGLPATKEAFERQLMTQGAVMGSYAKGAQEKFLRTCHPTWIAATTYESWAKSVLQPSKYKEVTDRYGAAPGTLLATRDSIAISCIRYGNVMLFPQPRPALGDDEFKLVHGSEVAPPHSYLAPYLYMQKEFNADALIHFGTHGNLEYTPGKNVGLSSYDWAEVLVGNRPHFYYYTTGNVGEAVIAKRRTHAALITYLTPPYAESGLRQKYSTLLDDIHKAIEQEGEKVDRALGKRIKQQVVKLGLHRDLNLDSILTKPYSKTDLERLDNYAEELCNEKMLGAYYTLGVPYSGTDLLNTTLAVSADPLAYANAKKDYESGKITEKHLHSYSYIAHNYLPDAQRRIKSVLASGVTDTAKVDESLRPAVLYRQQLLASTQHEMDAMMNALCGGAIAAAPGGDPVLNPNVLPTGRNMYSVNADMAPNERAWEDGKRLAENTLRTYIKAHGDYPRKVSYTFWAGEFITTEGATVAQVLWMMGVDIVRDAQGRIADIKLVPSKELGRPRINVFVQVSGQLRDIAGSRLKLITDAVKLASEAGDDEAYPNYVARGTRQQEADLVDKGSSPKEARALSTMRVFGPVNNGYSTGMLSYTEHSGAWNDEKELAAGFINNMSAMYGDDEHWGAVTNNLFECALAQTDVIVQPRQSNTWGPISLDHVYEFTGGLSLTVKTVTGKEPDALMADYRNSNNRRMQDTKTAIAVETRATILNTEFVKERMKGGAGSAQMFGEIFRNIFGWHAMRPSAMDENLFNDLYNMYVVDENKLGFHDYMMRTNPASYQSMTAVMMESARKGYWKPSRQQLQTVAKLHAHITDEAGAACTEFVCDNEPMQQFISQQLTGKDKEAYDARMGEMRNAGSAKDMVLKKQTISAADEQVTDTLQSVVVALAVIVFIVVIAILIRQRRKE